MPFYMITFPSSTVVPHVPRMSAITAADNLRVGDLYEADWVTNGPAAIGTILMTPSSHRVTKLQRNRTVIGCQVDRGGSKCSPRDQARARQGRLTWFRRVSGYSYPAL